MKIDLERSQMVAGVIVRVRHHHSHQLVHDVFLLVITWHRAWDPIWESMCLGLHPKSRESWIPAPYHIWSMTTCLGPHLPGCAIDLRLHDWPMRRRRLVRTLWPLPHFVPLIVSSSRCFVFGIASRRLLDRKSWWILRWQVVSRVGFKALCHVNKKEIKFLEWGPKRGDSVPIQHALPRGTSFMIFTLGFW